ncbi:50S ribosomal protein L24 [Mycoplasmopsis pullorum]|uniref:Large ribosomal subunit protein uL24 n=1 Tax=Mycoplasmopsis pullorum TaxID=48003 RepID=A0A1L4FS48_9BACT|nr:50S ribosomal protein L24 [Mycoplasmopsis pullorum]APJ38414.1 50S ribosomal protein L24 [Mycoplasmopsis pullorum]TNK82052.1 50S ribosomal protein L24 [Mycoplasmopsis pullorum]TNK82735.1 50S ribosomal protein L24 [Mycoplasmopsis pullorum]TNK84046.1 50S ribosomal protein L24 [Mycoplasmopsis pullorum]TNK84843.1 50S ribosomal protein L24 [Mycoplasmopsis pullorum]
MNKIKFKKNDEVIVIAGREKGKTGRIESVDHKKQTVIIKDLNMVTKHNKPSQQNTEGSISTKEAPIHVSNIAILVKKAGKNAPAQFSKIGYLVKDGKKVRVARKTQKEI